MKNFIKNLVLHDWLLPLVIWLAIFWKNIFSNLLFVDYVPSTFPDTLKSLYLSDFNYVFNPLDLLELILFPLGLLSYVFTISILIAMFISFFYIKRLFKEKGKVFVILFVFVFFFNPYIYTRILVGQIGVVLSYLFIPAFLYYLFDFFNSEIDKKSLIKLVMSMTLISLFAIHFFVINFIIFIVASFYFYFNKNRFDTRIYFKCFFIIIILLMLLNAFWIQGIFSSGIFSEIDSEHEDFFSPKMSLNVPAVAKIIGMWGFWRENGMITAYKSIPLIIWYIMIFLIIIMMLIGYLYKGQGESNFSLKDGMIATQSILSLSSLNLMRKSKGLEDKRKEALLFFTLFWIGVVLGTGISHPYTKPFFDFLFNYIPLFNGFRDSHKLVSLIAISYSYFISMSYLAIKEKYKKFTSIYLFFIIIFLLLFTFPLLGLWNQQKEISYPKDYYSIGNYLGTQKLAGYVIYLPWQNYVTYNWTYGISSDGRIVVPINQIIKQKVIVGSDEYGTETQLKRNISRCLASQNTACLENQGVEYVIKDKCISFSQNYSWFSLPVYENGCLSLYKLNNLAIEKQQVPTEFILGVLISIITLLILIVLLVT